MKHIKGIIATSHVDRHGEMLASEALQSLVEQINIKYIPMGVEHDPRIPPAGRLISAKLVKLEDGACAVEAVGEVFERGDVIPLSDDPREITLHAHAPDTLEVKFDRTYRDQESQSAINEIGVLLSASPQEEIKKALEPISILTIGGAFAAGAVAVSFLNRLGEDVYDTLKRKVKELLRRRSSDSPERLLVYEFTLMQDDLVVSAEVILTNPTDEDIDTFMDEGLKELDALAPKYCDPSTGLRKIVFEYSDKRLSVRFGVRKDAVPLTHKQIHHLIRKTG